MKIDLLEVITLLDAGCSRGVIGGRLKIKQKALEEIIKQARYFKTVTIPEIYTEHRKLRSQGKFKGYIFKTVGDNFDLPEDLIEKIVEYVQNKERGR